MRPLVPCPCWDRVNIQHCLDRPLRSAGLCYAAATFTELRILRRSYVGLASCLTNSTVCTMSVSLDRIAAIARCAVFLATRAMREICMIDVTGLCVLNSMIKNHFLREIRVPWKAVFAVTQ